MGRKNYRLTKDWTLRIRLKKEDPTPLHDPSHFLEFTHELDISLLREETNERFDTISVPWKEIEYPQKVYWNQEKEVLEIAGESQIIRVPLTLPLGLAAKIEFERDSMESTSSEKLLEDLKEALKIDNDKKRTKKILSSLQQPYNSEQLLHQLKTMEKDVAIKLLTALWDVIETLMDLDLKLEDRTAMEKVLEIGSQLIDVWGFRLLDNPEFLTRLVDFEAFLKLSISCLEAGRSIENMSAAHRALKESISKTKGFSSPYSVEMLHL